MLSPLVKILKCLFVGQATGRQADRQAHVDDFHLCTQTLKNVIIMDAPANHSTFWTRSRSLSVTTIPGEMETTDTDGVVLYHTCINKHATPATALISSKTCDQRRL